MIFTEIPKNRRKAYGAASGEKLLWLFSRTKLAQSYLAKIKGESLVDRATHFAKIRDIEGYVSM